MSRNGIPSQATWLSPPVPIETDHTPTTPRLSEKLRRLSWNGSWGRKNTHKDCGPNFSTPRHRSVFYHPFRRVWDWYVAGVGVTQYDHAERTTTPNIISARNSSVFQRRSLKIVVCLKCRLGLSFNGPSPPSHSWPRSMALALANQKSSF